jgi:hypothetical protein
MKKTAVISKDKRFRYQLSRIWDDQKPLMMFIMLNPSTANAQKDDPTIRRCIGFAESWGYGGILIGNLYAYRATDPNDLKLAGYPTGSRNTISLLQMADRVDLIVCAWGNSEGSIFQRLPYPIFIRHRYKLHYLTKTSDDSPGHPLYLKSTLKPIPWEMD